MTSSFSVISGTTSGFGFTSFIDTLAPTSTGSGGGNGDNGGNVGGYSGSSRAGQRNSQQVYIYTFLGLLLALSSLTAAIMLRNRVLRRRHERMVEEAIRNGTWVPPSLAPGGGKAKFGPKPKIWEVYVGEKEPTSPKSREPNTITEWELDSIYPFSAEYVDAVPTTATSGTMASDTPPASRPSLTGRVRRLFGLRPPPSTVHQLPMTSTTTGTATTQTTTPPSLDASSPRADVFLPPTPPPQKVRVAVLIAMPQAPESRPQSPTTPISPTSSTSTAIAPPRLFSTSEEEAELPYIEFGIAELDVKLPPNNIKDNRTSVVSGNSSIV